jgi:hypothetical protein
MLRLRVLAGVRSIVEDEAHLRDYKTWLYIRCEMERIDAIVQQRHCSAKIQRERNAYGDGCGGWKKVWGESEVSHALSGEARRVSSTRREVKMKENSTSHRNARSSQHRHRFSCFIISLHVL